jgi:hypothetical protein
MAQSVCSKCFVKLTHTQRREERFLCDVCEAEWARKMRQPNGNAAPKTPVPLPRAPAPKLADWG